MVLGDKNAEKKCLVIYLDIHGGTHLGRVLLFFSYTH
jgi:hypothetical protein